MLSDQESKAVHRKAHLVKLKGNDAAVCLKAKAALILLLSGYKIVTIQIEGYSEV